MKIVFFAINMTIGIFGLLLGIAAVASFFGSTHSFAALLVGIAVLALSGMCLCFCGDCICTRKKQDRLAI
jgi:hypothetical protein